MTRRAGYEESWDLTYRVEQLRELIGGELRLDASLAEELESTLAHLVTRNLRLRGLQRMTGSQRAPEDVFLQREALENMDRELLEKLPGLLDRLRLAQG